MRSTFITVDMTCPIMQKYEVGLMHIRARLDGISLAYMGRCLWGARELVSWGDDLRPPRVEATLDTSHGPIISYMEPAHTN